MSQVTIQSSGPVRAAGCDPAGRVTRSLLGYGVIAGPLYVVVSVTEALTRTGFDLRRHAWSLLTLGHLGWIHVLTFVVTGLATVAFAVGLRRAWPDAVWAPRLVGAYGVALVLAGVFRPDPALGFPAGTPDGPGPVSWHGALHFAVGGVGFACLAVACLAIGRRLAAHGDRQWALFSRVTGVLFLAGFLCIAAGAGREWATVTFTAAIILVWAWLSALAVRVYRSV